MNFLDILTTSSSTFISKEWGQDRRICSLILGVKGLNSKRHEMSEMLLVSMVTFVEMIIAQGEALQTKQQNTIQCNLFCSIHKYM